MIIILEKLVYGTLLKIIIINVLRSVWIEFFFIKTFICLDWIFFGVYWTLLIGLSGNSLFE